MPPFDSRRRVFRSQPMTTDRHQRRTTNDQRLMTNHPSDDEPPVPQERLAVDVDLAAVAQVADQIPVDRRLVDAARLRVAGADRHVDRAADLLVEQDVLSEAL